MQIAVENLGLRSLLEKNGGVEAEADRGALRENMAIALGFELFDRALSIFIGLAVGAAVTASIAIAIVTTRAMHQAAAGMSDRRAGERR